MDLAIILLKWFRDGFDVWVGCRAINYQIWERIVFRLLFRMIVEVAVVAWTVAVVR